METGSVGRWKGAMWGREYSHLGLENRSNWGRVGVVELDKREAWLFRKQTTTFQGVDGGHSLTTSVCCQGSILITRVYQYTVGAWSVPQEHGSASSANSRPNVPPTQLSST